MRTSTSNNFRAGAARRGQSGFTMLEMVVAMVVLMVGMLSLAQVLGYALTVSNRGRGATNTKLIVVSMLEQMENLRNTGQLTYGQIANAGAVDNNGAAFVFPGFPTDMQPLSRDPGPDGIFGTTDDLRNAGTDGVYGTLDDYTDTSLARPNFRRQVTITALSGSLKKIEVTLEYRDAQGRLKTLKGTSYLNNDSRSNELR